MEAIFDPSLSLAMDDGGMDESPQYKVTNFTCYCKEGHVVRFDTDLIEKNKEIFFSGYLKHITCEDPSIDDGIPVFDCGPIGAWWNTGESSSIFTTCQALLFSPAGFDGGEKCLTGFTTGFAEYFLMEPSELYRPVARIFKEKTYLVKYVIEFLEKAVVPENHLDCEYEDLMNALSLVVPPPDLPVIDDELLLRHADFVVHQVIQLDVAPSINSITKPLLLKGLQL